MLKMFKLFNELTLSKILFKFYYDTDDYLTKWDFKKTDIKYVGKFKKDMKITYESNIMSLEIVYDDDGMFKLIPILLTIRSEAVCMKSLIDILDKTHFPFWQFNIRKNRKKKIVLSMN